MPTKPSSSGPFPPTPRHGVAGAGGTRGQGVLVAEVSAPRRVQVQLKPLEDLPLTPEERAIMERLRGEG